MRVPLGQRELLGVVWDASTGAAVRQLPLDPAKLRPMSAALDALPPLNASWRALIDFAASYYQRAAGEVALAALPPQLRDLSSAAAGPQAEKTGQSSRSRRDGASQATANAEQRTSGNAITFSSAQRRADTGLSANFMQSPGPFLLFGATGSGKTEVFMHCTAELLAELTRRPGTGDGARDQPDTAAGRPLQGPLLRTSMARMPWCRCTAA